MKLEQLLKQVEKPTRYLGEERGSVIKNPDEVKADFLLAFPDLYEVGMSHMGLHILYGLLNEKEDFLCERLFAPAADMEKLIREGKTPLFSIENKRPMKDFDMIGFTLQYEMSFTTILGMLELGGLALRSKDRGPEDPLIIAGGPCAFNPEPMSAFIDLFVLGDGEEVLLELMELWLKTGKKDKFLKEALKIRGVYVPKYYEPEFSGGLYKGLAPLIEEAPLTIQKALINDLDHCYYPKKMIVPYMDIVHDRAVMEIFRGCTKGCRFCQAGIIYRPLRERSVQTLVKAIDSLLTEGGYDEVGLSSLSTLDYSGILPLVEELTQTYSEDHIRLSLPSLRLDTFSIDVLRLVQKRRKGSLTFAPEAGSQRMRDIINKNVNEKDLFSTMEEIFKEGYKKVKLYFIMGLPGENMEDVEAIAELAYKVVDLYKEVTGKRNVEITISTSCLVPKPFTPFQWMAQEKVEDFEEKQRYLRGLLRGKSFRYNYHDAKTSVVEGRICRGGRKMADVLELAYKKGAFLEAWMENFDETIWQEAFKEMGMDFDQELSFSLEETLPWDHIDVGVKKEFLKKEWMAAQKGQLTPDCRQGCLGCGVNLESFGGVCYGN
ncbi:MAG TPA: TIGR03960 family B12-binding radical SAM protein [Clostridia bacterium]|nr:TIGR03960 family B12-binding radical SAM protein [Clostridia bacterium]